MMLFNYSKDLINKYIISWVNNLISLELVSIKNMIDKIYKKYIESSKKSIAKKIIKKYKWYKKIEDSDYKIEKLKDYKD